MSFEFRLPDIGEGVAEGEVVQWFVKEGDSIAEDAPLVSVLTDKANVEIPSPKAGRIARIHAQVGEKVKVGGLLVTIETAGGVGPSTVAPTPSSQPTARAPTTPVPATTSPSVPPSAPSGDVGRILASPYLRRLAAEKGVDLRTIRGSGPGGRITEADLDGGSKLPTPTVLGATPSPPSAAEAPRTASAASGTVPPTASPDSSDVLQRIPIRGIRRAIADRMSLSTHTAAHFTYVEEVDVTELVVLRERMAKHVERQGAKLSYLPFFVKAVVAGLRAHPRLNATMDDARSELVLHSAFNIGIATAAPEGLIVPVLHGADRKSVLQLSREIADLAERGRAGKLARAEMTGGTFTITSLGALGGVLATPILNYPEVAIMGVHKIQRRPVYLPDGAIGPADLMNLSVSLDHRVLDGIEGAQFLATVKSYLEDPHQLFAEMA
ncbi:MAG: dihydrolipoamide acetyltransferase family protein [Thermoplasmata archaeon]|jgi:pyruvate dehydrogenase E2 component (dihydrolipoamide acetyltransferase)